MSHKRSTMSLRMLIIIVLTILLTLCIYVTSLEDRAVFMPSAEKSNKKDSSSGSGFVKSFDRLRNKLRDFFQKTFDHTTSKMEEKRQKLKKAFRSFISEALFDKKYDPNKLALHRLNDIVNEAFEDPQMSASRYILYHGYHVEVHTVVTHDNYRLRLHRILQNSTSLKTVRTRTVILHHGLMGSSDDWLLLGPRKALPYLLTDAGYDVWLTNARGNKYSRSKANFSNETKFWDFSFHEMGTLDLPAVIDYVNDKSGRGSEIDFVGFSMGATALLIQLSMLPEYNRILKSATLLAPLAFMHEIKGLLKLLAELHQENSTSLNFFGVNEFMPVEAFPHQVIKNYCEGDERLCFNPLLLIANGGKEIMDKDILNNILDHQPNGASMKTIMHYIQLVNSGQFQMYDFGASANRIKYGDDIPPKYDLSKITLPIILFSSYDDWLSTHNNIYKLFSLLPNVVVQYVIKEHEFSHTDFVWGEEAPRLVFDLLLENLKKPR